MVRNQAIGEEEGFDVRSDDEFHDLADDLEQADWSAVAGIGFSLFFVQGSNICFADFTVDSRCP